MDPIEFWVVNFELYSIVDELRHKDGIWGLIDWHTPSKPNVSNPLPSPRFWPIPLFWKLYSWKFPHFLRPARFWDLVEIFLDQHVQRTPQNWSRTWISQKPKMEMEDFSEVHCHARSKLAFWTISCDIPEHGFGIPVLLWKSGKHFQTYCSLVS